MKKQTKKDEPNEGSRVPRGHEPAGVLRERVEDGKDSRYRIELSRGKNPTSREPREVK